MTHKLLLCLALVLSVGLPAHARLVRLWGDSELMKASDLVVIATPLASKDLDETNSLGWSAGGFRGVETTFKVFDALKRMPANDRIILHHYRFENGSPANGPTFINFTPDSTNKLILYLIKDGTNRYAPVTGQIDSSFSIRPLPANRPFQFGFPSVPPMADADPSIRHAMQVHVPVRLLARHVGDSIKIYPEEMVLTNLTVGANMATGTEFETRTYQGDKLVNTGGRSLQDGLVDGGYNETLPPNFVNFLTPDESFTYEIKVTLFETDEPSQHMWSPRSGEKYRVLFEQAFKVAVK